VAQPLHGLDVVVDALEQHRLVVERDARARELVAGPQGLRGELARVVEVDVDPQRVVLLQHLAQLVVDALREGHGHAAADADDLEVRDGPQLREDALELGVL
jgi:hypothetical protein